MRSVGVLFCLCLIPFAAFAQSDRGTMTGTISDTTGGVIPGVNIVATNVETGARYETISTETGNYTLAQIPAGVYQLSAELPGFKRYVRQGITVLVAQTLRLDIALEVGSNTESITITEAAPSELPPPPWFSTTIVPRSGLIRSAHGRPIASKPPPGGNGMISRTGLVG